MRIHTLVTLGASVTFGLLAVLLAKNWINDAVNTQYANTTVPIQQDMPLASTPTRPVIIADIEYAFGDSLNAQGLRLVDMPEDLIPFGAFSDFDALLGDMDTKTVALSKMTINEPILDYKVSGPGGRGSLSAIISDGMRASSIRVNAVAGVGGFILPGDHVDVILTKDAAVGEQRRRMTADVILQNVKVLGTDQNADTNSADVNVVQTVTLEVTPVQAQKLTLAMDVGALSLSLRGIQSTLSIPTRSVSETALNSSASVKTRPARTRTYGSVKKAAPKSSTANVTIIRSGEREAVSVRKELLETQKGAALAGAKG